MFDNSQPGISVPSCGQVGTSLTGSQPCPPDTLGSKARLLQDATGDLLAIAGRIHALHFGPRPTNAAQPEMPGSLSDLLTLANNRIGQAQVYLAEIEKEFA